MSHSWDPEKKLLTVVLDDDTTRVLDLDFHQKKVDELDSKKKVGYDWQKDKALYDAIDIYFSKIPGGAPDEFIRLYQAMKEKLQELRR